MNLDNYTSATFPKETSRVKLYPISSQHWQDFLALHQQPSILKYISTALSESELREKFERGLTYPETPEHWCSLMMYDKVTHQFIGSFGMRISHRLNQRAELGFMCMNTMQGKGYITEVGNAVIEYLFNEIHVKKIEAFCSSDNSASTKVMDKLGLKQEGLLKEDHLVENEWQDTLVFGLVSP